MPFSSLLLKFKKVLFKKVLDVFFYLQ